MIWDEKQRRYEDEHGRPLSVAETRKFIQEYIDAEQEDVKRTAQSLLDGVITVSDFFEFMRHKISTWHSVSGVIAYGGEGEMDDERWARINQKILSELEFLNEFEDKAQESFDAVDSLATQAAQSAMRELQQWQSAN